MIYPTLFVGLGTTGLNILERLQDLVSEEYKERPSIFAYVYLETDDGKKPERRPGMRDEITVPSTFPVIQNLHTLRQDFAAGKRPYLEPWLNPRLLEFPGRAFKAGAGYIRMAGRLCLWENWTECTRILTEARNTITAVQNIAATNNFLRSFYQKVNQPQPAGTQLVGPVPNVYVVGTLCGGTCGGMFIDVAYFLRDLFGLQTNRKQAKLQGIFTVPDSLIARQPQSDQERKRCANAWASMFELDYYNHPSTRYEASWPDGRTLATGEPPFDWTYLVSCSGDETNLLNANGGADVDALNEMVAMFLFTETVSDLLQRKDAIRVNFMGHPQFNMPHPVTESMPAISTFGLSAFHYPKHRIAEAAACHQAVEFCQAWIGADVVEEKLTAESEARAEWDRILRKHLPVLTRRGGGAIEDDIRRWFETNGARAAGQPWDQTAAALRTELERLEEGRDWDKIVGDPLTVGGFETALRKEIRDTLLARINTTRNFTLVEAFLAVLDAAIAQTINRLPTRYPRPETAKIPAVTGVDAYTRFVLRKGPVERQKRAATLDRCRDYFIDVLRLVRGFRSRPALENIRKYIGVGVVPVGDEARVQELLSREVSQLRGVLERSAEKLQRREQDLARPLAATQNISLVFSDEDGGLERDIQDLCARMRAESREDTIRRILTTPAGGVEITLALTDFLVGGDEKVMEKMVVEFRRDSLDHVQQFRIPETVIRRRDPDELRLFAGRALPHLELKGPLVPIQHPCFMVGGDGPGMPALGRLAAYLTDQNATNRIDFGDPVLTQLLDHFLVFYTETGLLRIDENLGSSDALRDRYAEAASSDPYGLHVHKDGAAFFDKHVMKRDRQLRGLLDVLTQVLHFTDACGDWHVAAAVEQVPAALEIATRRFRTDGKTLYIVYKRRDDTDDQAIPNENGRKKLARDDYAFDLVKNDVGQILKAVGPEGYPVLLNAHLARLDATERAKGTPPDRIIQVKDESYSNLKSAMEQVLA